MSHLLKRDKLESTVPTRIRIGRMVSGSIRTRISQKPLDGGKFLLFLDATLKYTVAKTRSDLLGHHQRIVVGHATYVVGGGTFVRFR